jgi:hypothetical protein
MRVRWSLKIGNTSQDQISSFKRDDDYVVLDPPPAARPFPPNS